MKKYLSLLLGISMILCLPACSSEENERSEGESIDTTTESSELTRKIEFEDISFNISPYWITEENENILSIKTETGDIFKVSRAKVNDDYNNFDDYCDSIIKNCNDSTSATAEAIENLNGVKMLRYYKDVGEYGIILSYTIQFTGNENTAFFFSDFGDSSSYIPEILDSVSLTTN